MRLFSLGHSKTRIKRHLVIARIEFGGEVNFRSILTSRLGSKSLLAFVLSSDGCNTEQRRYLSFAGMVHLRAKLTHFSRLMGSSLRIESNVFRSSMPRKPTFS